MIPAWIGLEGLIILALLIFIVASWLACLWLQIGLWKKDDRNDDEDQVMMSEMPAPHNEPEKDNANR